MQKFIGSRLHLAIILFLGIIIAGSYSYLSVMDANSTGRSEQDAGSVNAADYEYSSTTFDSLPTAKALNEWAENGLELITIVPFAGDDNSMSYAAYFKRR